MGQGRLAIEKLTLIVTKGNPIMKYGQNAMCFLQAWEDAKATAENAQGALFQTSTENTGSRVRSNPEADGAAGTPVNRETGFTQVTDLTRAFRCGQSASHADMVVVVVTNST